MISFIRGELSEVYAGGVVIDCNGVGYDLMMSTADLSQLPPIGAEIKVHSFLNVNENTGVSLFGFLHKDDLNMFKLLITVSGIGPKGAQAILSGMTADALRFAILAEDAKSISKAPGIGAKTAQKIVLELKDKIDFAETIENLKPSDTSAANAALSGAKEEAVMALVSLGYSKTEATQAVSKVELTEGMEVDEILSKSLKFMR